MADGASAPDYAKKPDDNFGVKQISWLLCGGAAVGKAVEFPDYNDKSIQVGCGESITAGNTFGGATCVIQGTNDVRGDPNHADYANAQFRTLNDPLGNALSFTNTGFKQILENPRWIRPSFSGGTGSSVDVVIVGKRTR